MGGGKRTTGRSTCAPGRRGAARAGGAVRGASREDAAPKLPRFPMSVLTTMGNKTGTWKYVHPEYVDKVAPCSEGCPAGEDVEAQLYLAGTGREIEASEQLRRENPLPAVCGRVCFHPCESVCNRRAFDEAIAINALERHLGDLALTRAKVAPAERRFAERVAVVGSGPAGLACAYHLARFGYGVTIYEAMPVAGGVLAIGIPAYRLPKDVLAAEIDLIRRLGVEIRTNARVGERVPWSEIEAYDAVFLGTGVHVSRRMKVPNEDAVGVLSGLAFLRDLNLGKPPEIGPRVAVIGGGNTAMDAARAALRMGCEVEVVYRRSRAEMPANHEEVTDAEAEGIPMRFLAAPTAVRVQNGKVVGLDCVRMELGDPDESGRRRPVPVAGSEFRVAADTILTAIGEAPDLGYLGVDLDRAGESIRVGPLGETSRPGFFAGGDVVPQDHTVAHAIGSGKAAAVGIHRYLAERRGESLPGLAGTTAEAFAALRIGRTGAVAMTRLTGDHAVPKVGRSNEVVAPERIRVHYFDHAPRVERPKLAPKEAVDRAFPEVVRPLGARDAEAEAGRCFHCGVCDGCEVCLILCPDVAVGRDGAVGPLARMRINMDYCKGCGICVYECPRDAMALVREAT